MYLVLGQPRCVLVNQWEAKDIFVKDPFHWLFSSIVIRPKGHHFGTHHFEGGHDGC